MNIVSTNMCTFNLFYLRFRFGGHSGYGDLDIAVSLLNKARSYKAVAVLGKHDFRYVSASVSRRFLIKSLSKFYDYNITTHV